MTKISIITPTYNAEKFLENNIKNILSQKFYDIEHILVDAMSNDNTLSIVNKYRDHFSKVIIEKDFGIYDGMNKGIVAAQGELIGILNADDYYNKEALSSIMATYEQSQNKDIIIYGDMNIQYKKTSLLSRGDLSDDAFKKGQFKLNHPATFVAKSVYKNIGLFNIKYTSGADREFLLRAYHNKIKFLKIEKPLATFSIGGFTSSYSLKIIIDRTKEEFQIFKKYYPKSYAIKRSMNHFLRMLRNAFFVFFLGRENFLKIRIKWLLKND